MDHFCLRLEPFDAIRTYLGALGFDGPPLADNYGADGEGPPHA